MYVMAIIKLSVPEYHSQLLETIMGVKNNICKVNTTIYHLCK